MRGPARSAWMGVLLLSGLAARAQQLAFTWDDLPAHSRLPPGETRVAIADRILRAWKASGAPPVFGFVNGVRTEEEPASTPVLKAWRDAGNPLGNHTWTHLNLRDHTVEEFKADVIRNEALLAQEMPNADWHWLRYPNLQEGETPEKRDAVRAFLAGRGYRIAGVTMSFGDYLWNEPYARCVAKSDSAAIKELESSYLDAAAATADYTRSLSQALFGHDIPYVLLMHVGALDARMLTRLLELYKQRGFALVSLEQAERDPFYANDLDLKLPAEPDTLEAAARMRHIEVPQRPRPSFDLASVCRSDPK